MGDSAVPASTTRAGCAITDRARALLLTEIAIVSALALVGLAMRAWGHMELPRLTDETLEVRLGWRIAQGETLPLIGAQPYIGALSSYLVAAVFLLAGPRVDAGRWVAIGGGTLTLLATYLLGWELGAAAGSPGRGRLVGVLGMLGLVLSGPHILVSSRIAYSNSLTPCFATVGLWLLTRALRRHDDWSLVGAALTLGLAIQTHMTALAIAPGVILATLLTVGVGWRSAGDQRAWPTRTLLGVASAAALLAVGNLIVYNLLTGFGGLSTANYRAGRYTQATGGSLTLLAWGERLGALAKAVALAVSHQVSEDVWPLSHLLAPQIIAVVALALLGLWSCARRGRWLPLLVTLSVLATLPLVTDRVEPVVPRVRHYASLLPLGAVMVAEGLTWLHRLLQDRVQTTLLAHVFLAGGVLGIGAMSVHSLNSYTAERLARPEKNNLAYLATLRAIGADGTPDETVYLDRRLSDVLTMSGGRMLTHLHFAFELAGQHVDVIDLDWQPLPIGPGRVVSRRVILASETIPLAKQRYRLDAREGGPGADAPFRVFRAYGPP